MSKIYEALLRAEQDRANQEKAEKDRASGVVPAYAASVPAVIEPVPAELQPPAPVAYAAPAPAPVFVEPAPAQAGPPQRAISSAAMPVAPAPVLPTTPAAPAPIVSAPVVSAPVVSAPVVSVPIPAPVVPAAPVPPALVEIQPTPLPLAQPALARSAPSDDRTFSPDKIRRHLWSPSLDTLPALEDRGAPVEQFRSLRSRMFEFRDLNKLKSIMVSSGLPQEGKSFVATNLAIAFARHKAARVLLIDGDMRRSTLHKLLGASPEIGLAEYLSGSAGLLDVMQQMQPTEDAAPILHGLASLTFIPGGSDSEKAADLSGNPRFAQLMATVSPFYDWIVVDSAPVNVVADGVNLARSCDGVLLVARGGVTKYEVAQRALVELKASNILGFVLNAVETSPLTGGYYGYESYDSLQK